MEKHSEGKELEGFSLPWTKLVQETGVTHSDVRTMVEDDIERANWIHEVERSIESLEILNTDSLANDSPDSFGKLVVLAQEFLKEHGEKYQQINSKNGFTEQERTTIIGLTKRTNDLFSQVRARALNFKTASEAFATIHVQQ